MLRIALSATTACAITAGVLAVVPNSASAAVVPSLASVSASPKTVTTVGKLNAAKKVTITAVYNDPDKVLEGVAFAGVPLKAGLGTNAKDFTSVDSGARRSYSWTFDEDYNSKPGVTRAYVIGIDGYNYLAGTGGSTSYVVKNKPLLSIKGSRSISYIWGTKARLVGNLTSTPANANRKITIAFDKKGKQKGKQWKTKQVVKTNLFGAFQTKKFKINTAGTWRATYAGSTYVLSAKGTFKVKKP